MSRHLHRQLNLERMSDPPPHSPSLCTPSPSHRQSPPAKSSGGALAPIFPARTKLPTSVPSSSHSSNNDSGSGSAIGSTTTASSYAQSQSSLRPSVDSVKLPPRIQPTRVACEPCRNRRTKCSGERPTCAACVKHRLGCSYASASSAETHSAALKRRFGEVEHENNVYQQLYESLLTLPEKQAFEIFRRIRMGASATTIARQLHDSDLLLQVSLVPEARPRSSFPFHADMPQAIRRSNNNYMKSLLYEAVDTEGLFQSRVDGASRLARNQHERQDLAKGHPPQYTMPYHAAKLVEPKLNAVNVMRWTTVITDNDLCVAMLSSYLLQEYPGVPVFHKDTFLQALVDGDRRFCSPLLINSLLAEACHCHPGIPNRSKYWDPQNLGYRFLAEAKRLWELERGPCTLLHVEAATLIYLVHCHNGLDEIGLLYLEKAVLMGYELGIFGSASVVGDQEMGNARLFTAWALFRVTVAAGFHFKRRGIMEATPETPLPEPAEHPELYGEIYLHYPLEASVYSTNNGLLFRAWASLRSIMNEIAFTAFTTAGAHMMPADKWLAFRQQLDAWSTELEKHVGPTYIIWPAQLAIHMEFQTVLLTLSRIHISEPLVGAPSLVTAAREAAMDISPHADVRFETVMRLYYLRHSFESYDINLTHLLSVLADIVIESRTFGNTISSDHDTNGHLRSTLFLCLQGLATQGQHVHVAAVIYKLLCDRQSPEDLELLGSCFGTDSLEGQSMLGQCVLSAYPLEMITADDPESSRLGNLTRKFHLKDS